MHFQRITRKKIEEDNERAESGRAALRIWDERVDLEQQKLDAPMVGNHAVLLYLPELLTHEQRDRSEHICAGQIGWLRLEWLRRQLEPLRSG